MEANVFAAVFAGIVILLFLILRLKIPAFIALLLVSMLTAVAAGMDPALVMDTIKNGMGSTLGFVATIVGLGAIFGGILEHTGSARALAGYLLSIIGASRASWAMMLTGFLVSIPIFFDVGFIILFPLIAGLHRTTGKSLVHYAVPLLAGLAVSHAFIPPTPGPLAVAEIIGAPLGWMVVVGVIAGLPAAWLSGIVYGKYIGNRLDIQLQGASMAETLPQKIPSVGFIFPILLSPIILIVINALFSSGVLTTGQPPADKILGMLTHPFASLLIANLLAWYLLGKKSGLNRNQLADISTRSLYPAGAIILVTGAGGVFKQVLIDTGAGKMLAMAMQEAGLGIVVFAFLTATVIRVLQGSATVAMITAGGLVAPLLPELSLSDLQLAAVAICIASGATMASHLNDSGFWLVKELMRLDEKDGIRTWTVASTILGLTGFAGATVLYYFGG